MIYVNFQFNFKQLMKIYIIEEKLEQMVMNSVRNSWPRVRKAKN
jgi:hypothetical protein